MQEHDFFQAILESPDEVAPRLVYADWLDEMGDPRGEFIRLQCERETLSERDPRCLDLDYRERSLLAEYRNIWAKPVRKWGRVIGYRRGFVEDITLRADAFLETGEELLAVSPIRRVKLTHLKDNVTALAKSPLLTRIQELSVRDSKCGLARLKVLLKSRYIKSIQGFDFSFNGLRMSAIRELIAADTLGPLKSLALDSCNLSDGGLRLLLESHLVNQLEKLELRSNNFTNLDAEQIADCPKLAQLKELHLDFNDGISSQGIRRIMESENLGSLRVLSLRGWGARREVATVTAFPQTTPLSELVRLDMEGSWLENAGIRQLAKSEWVDRLVHLNLSKNYADGPAFDPLFEPGRLKHLRTLRISWNRLDHRIVERLESLGHSRLTDLDLGGAIGNKGAKRLAQSEQFQKLNVLNLRGSGITDTGANALARSETLNRITELRMTTSPGEASWNKTPGVSDKVTKLLIERFGKHVCYFD